MAISKDTKQGWASASSALSEALTDFILSRQAMLCSQRTLAWYSFTLGKFMQWLEDNGATTAQEITAKHVRAYLASLAERRLEDSTINNHGRAIRTLLRFFHAEKYIREPITFQIPSIAEKRLPCLSGEAVTQLLDACQLPRDRALLLLMVDTGLRRAELCALNWEDMDIATGVVRVVRGKGGKARSVVVGVSTRRALLAYRRSLTTTDEKPVFQTSSGGRLSFNGLRSLLLRLGKRAGVKVSPHALRRTFATLSLRAGMNLIHLQGLMGHSTIEMTKHYVQLLDEDLVQAHRAHGPIDNLLRKERND
ncbi:MAG TPA: tyrosine-type recombinase/integrase [Anaerolineales bacterium]|nr:tyrosine-type recombinase/integrase [Anaerolineales bacterium]